MNCGRRLTWFLAGCGVTLAQPGGPARDHLSRAARITEGETFTTRELSAFITFWDGHRKPVDIANNGVSLNFGALAMASLWLLAFKEIFRGRRSFCCDSSLVSAVLSIGLVFVSWIPPERLPAMLLVLMPGPGVEFRRA